MIKPRDWVGFNPATYWEALWPCSWCGSVFDDEHRCQIQEVPRG